MSHGQSIPASIITAVNELLIKNFNADGTTIIFVKDILNLVCSEDENSGKPTRNEVYDNRWLDFEPIYRCNGWRVSFHKLDDGTQFFEFS